MSKFKVQSKIASKKIYASTKSLFISVNLSQFIQSVIYLNYTTTI